MEIIISCSRLEDTEEVSWHCRIEGGKIEGNAFFWSQQELKEGRLKEMHSSGHNKNKN
jgi:hypothetical protein